MAVTVDLVKKLILQHIGGKPLLGNPKQVFINQGKNLVAIQIPHLGALGSLTGTLGNLVNQATSAVDGLSKLVQNPMAAISGQVNSLAGSLLSNVQSLGGLATADLNKIVSSVGSLQSAANGLLDHTNILSGVTQDIDAIGTTVLGAQDLMQIQDTSDVQSLAGALFANDSVDAIRQSLDPSVPGGVSSLVDTLKGADPSQLPGIAANVSKQLDDHAATLTSIVQSDLTAHANYIQRQDIVNSTINLLPNNDAQSLLFDRIATSTLQAINTELSIGDQP